MDFAGYTLSFFLCFYITGHAAFTELIRIFFRYASSRHIIAKTKRNGFDFGMIFREIIDRFDTETANRKVVFVIPCDPRFLFYAHFL